MSDLEQFRQETRAWLQENCPQSMRTPVKGFEDFYKLPYNPILEKGSGWEASEVNGPGLIMVEEKFLMFYTGYSSATLLNQIGLATIP